MKTTKIFNAISIARMNAPQWELYTFDNERLGEQVVFDLRKDDNTPFDFIEELSLNGNYLFSWFYDESSAEDFSKMIRDELKDDDNSIFYMNIIIIDDCARYNHNPHYLVITQLDHEL